MGNLNVTLNIVVFTLNYVAQEGTPSYVLQCLYGRILPFYNHLDTAKEPMSTPQGVCYQQKTLKLLKQ